MKNNFQSIQAFKNEQNLLEFLEQKQIKFEAYIIIISDQFFSKYITYLLNNSINNIPISIVFTKNENELKQKNEKYLNHKFYNPLGVSTTIEDLIQKIKNLINEYNEKINELNLGSSPPPNDYNDCFVFEYIDDECKLIFPYLYHKIMKNAKISDEEIKKTNKYILEKYGKIEEIKNLLIPLLILEDIPSNIIAKFWARIYTLENSFYRNLNNNLMKLKDENYNEYVQMLYIGLKEYEFKDDITLYRGSNISEKEIENILNYYKNKKIENENQPLYLIYSRAFLSFSKDLNISRSFIKDNKNTKKILFKLKSNINNKILSNAYLYKLSYFPNENEVLFFPFSAFVIESITNEDDIYHINLEYIGIYEEKIKNKMAGNTGKDEKGVAI